MGCVIWCALCLWRWVAYSWSFPFCRQVVQEFLPFSVSSHDAVCREKRWEVLSAIILCNLGKVRCINVFQNKASHLVEAFRMIWLDNVYTLRSMYDNICGSSEKVAEALVCLSMFSGAGLWYKTMFLSPLLCIPSSYYVVESQTCNWCKWAFLYFCNCLYLEKEMIETLFLVCSFKWKLNIDFWQ